MSNSISSNTSAKTIIPHETRMMHTATSCGVSIRATSQKAKNEHGRDVVVRFAEIKNPNNSDTDNLTRLLENITPPTKEIKAFQTANDINYPHSANNHTTDMTSKENVHDAPKVLFKEDEANNDELQNQPPMPEFNIISI